MGTHTAVVDQLAEHLAERRPGHPLRVGIDGRCGSGKSSLARESVAALSSRVRQAIHLDSDGFHHERRIRYRQGRTSAVGYYDDAYDFESLATRTLEPLGPGGSRRFARAIHDLDTDTRVDDTIEADPEAVAVFDCTFLQRGALRALWDEVIYLDVDREIAMRRGIARDAAVLDGEAAAREAYESRYMAASDLYLADEDPIGRAGIVLGYDDPQHPTIDQWHAR